MKSEDSNDLAVTYDRARIAGFFDAFGEREWSRLDQDAGQRASFHLHRRMLERYVEPGHRVLEIGAGPGRFTLELARLGASVTVTDVSPAQLDLNRSRVASDGGAAAVSEWRLADVTDLSGFPDGAFDGVIALGGPLSYVLERRDAAIAEMKRVARSGGYILTSVMSRAGTVRRLLIFVRESYEGGDPATIDAIKRDCTTGDLVDPRTQAEGHYMHLFTARELRSLLEDHGLVIEEMSAANFITVQNEEWLEEIDPASGLWGFVLQLEEHFAGEPGTLDGGTHIMAAARKPAK